jgi:hypothetical protein
MKKKDFLWIALAALAFRAVYLFFLVKHPQFDLPSMDAAFHDDMAWLLARGTFHGTDQTVASLANNDYYLTFRAPLYMQVLSVPYHFLDRGVPYYALVRVVQFLLGVVTCVLIAAQAAAMFGRSEGIVAGLLSAVCWQYIYYEGELLMESLLVFLFVMIMHASLRTFRRPDSSSVTMSAVWIGVYFLARPNILAVVPVLLAFLLYVKKPKLAVLFAAVLLAFPLAHGFRSRMLTGSFLMMPTQGGVNFFIGNNPDSDGMTAIVPGTRPSWEGGYDDTISIAESSVGRPLTAAEISSYWFNKGLDYVVANPTRSALGYFRKLRLLFNNEEISNNQNVYHAVRTTKVLRALPGYALYAPFALAGVIWFARNKEVLFLLCICGFYLSSFLPFFVNGRYRLPVLALGIVLASAALARIARAVVAGVVKEDSSSGLGIRANRPGVSALLLVAVPVLAAALLHYNNTPVIRYDDGDYELAATWLRKGEVEKAREMFLKTRAMSEPFGSMSDVSLGSICVAAGQLREAARFFSAALAKNGLAAKDIEAFLKPRRLRYVSSPEPDLVRDN